MAEPKKPKIKGVPKRYGTLIRVTDEFADEIREAAALHRTSVAEYATTHLQPVMRKEYKETFLKKARKLEGKG